MQPKLWIITGANGHFANTLVRELLAQKESVLGFVLTGDQSKALAGLGVEIVEGNIVDPANIEHLIDDCGTDVKDICLIHAAGIVSIDFKEKERIHQVNVGGTRNIAEICLRKGIGRFVYISSVHAIPELPDKQTIIEVTKFDPDWVEGLYAKSKAEATREVLQLIDAGLSANLVFPSGMIGPNDYGCSHMTQMVLDYGAGRLKAYVDGGYDFADVRDVAAAVICVVKERASGEHYILSGDYISVKEIVTALGKVFPATQCTTKMPLALAKASAPLAEIYYRLLKQKPLYTRYSLFTLASNSNFSHALASHDIGYAPRKAEESLIDMAHWLIDNGRIKKGS
ncbi:MAG: NAD-dependent epimerase/dehydratase family protein [Erysipelotrichaceae bacterium]